MINRRTDMAIDKNKEYKRLYKYNDILVLGNKNKKCIYHTIKFNNKSIDLIYILKREIHYFIRDLNISHILFIGLGNESNTPDSIGPKTIKKIKVNYNNSRIKVSALIPGVLGITGINTNLIIESVINRIKPSLIIVIDSVVSNKIERINNTIEISNTYLSPGSGINGNNEVIKTKIPIISIGIPTALEYIKKNIPFILTPTNIDTYINDISTIISKSFNDLIYKDLNDTPV